MVAEPSNLTSLADESKRLRRAYPADHALIERMRSGEQRAFDEFFNANATRLAAFVSRRSSLDPATLEDVVQCSLIKAVRHLNSYRGEAALFTWLTEICRHELADVHRKAKRRPAHVSLDEPEAMFRLEDQLSAPRSHEPAAQLNASLERDELRTVLKRLPAHYAEALEAKYGDGLSVGAIARQLGLTEIAAQSVLARAREAFRQRWESKPRSRGFEDLT